MIDMTCYNILVKKDIGKQNRLNKKTIYNIHSRFYTLDTDKDKDEKRELLLEQFNYKKLKLYYPDVNSELFDIYNDKIEFFNISHVIFYLYSNNEKVLENTNLEIEDIKYIHEQVFDELFILSNLYCMFLILDNDEINNILNFSMTYMNRTHFKVDVNGRIIFNRSRFLPLLRKAFKQIAKRTLKEIDSKVLFFYENYKKEIISYPYNFLLPHDFESSTFYAIFEPDEVTADDSLINFIYSHEIIRRNIQSGQFMTKLKSEIYLVGLHAIIVYLTEVIKIGPKDERRIEPITSEEINLPKRNFRGLYSSKRLSDKEAEEIITFVRDDVWMIHKWLVKEYSKYFDFLSKILENKP